ncbi:sodium-dependent phosphate transporter 1-A isoform X2 [Bacillus rossius redtenbacheri]|uniref:sodium-dependent phosphate transporter 1-A isoform X2 n=1 Tax=Bacillus rossius redtenbacheri TaxID=93214 RepID=UPI002FDD2FCF
MLEPYSEQALWIVVVGFVVAFVLAFGIGANDVANSFGTSVGSKVLTVKQACCLATVFEIAGAVLIGYKVSDTMRKGILDVKLYENEEMQLMLGCLSSLGGSAVWLILATFLKLPISGTHSIVGATVGFSLVCKGTKGLHWTTLGMIVASWFVSPVLSGVMSVVLFSLIRRFILRAPEPLAPGLRALPFFYGITVAVNIFSIVHDGPKLLYFDRIPVWGTFVVSLGLGSVVMLLVHFLVVPHQRKQILDSSREASPRGSVENIPRALPAIAEGCEVSKTSLSLSQGDTSEMVQLAAGPPPAQVYCFPAAPQTNGTKSNGYVLAETALADSSKDEKTLLTAENAALVASGNGKSLQSLPAAPSQQQQPLQQQQQQSQSQQQLQTKEELSKKSAGNVTPTYGLSPNSSAVPLIRNKTAEEMQRLEVDPAAVETEETGVPDDPPQVVRLFSFLQILTATFGSFAHGGNDVSNAIGPLIALWLVYVEGSAQQKSETPLYILLYGGLGITMGLWLWGRRVIKTIGEDLTKITASTGFTIEIGAAFTVLLASKVGIPISTTHCKVGSVVFVGWASTSKGGVDWKLFRNIIFAWVVTLPLAAGLSAAIMATLQAVVL